MDVHSVCVFIVGHHFIICIFTLKGRGRTVTIEISFA